MTTTTSVRLSASLQLRDLIRAALPGVQVEYGWPAADLQTRAVWIDDISDGTVVPETMVAGRRIRNDTFTISVQFAAGQQGNTFEDAARDVELLYGAFVDVISENPTLDALPCVVHAVQNGTTTGPELVLTAEGGAAFMTASVEVRTRLQ